MVNQYWADDATANCVWCFQTKVYAGPITFWHTERVFLTQKEAMRWGQSRTYALGTYKDGWRIWGVPADGIMVELLGQHNKDFEKEVEHIDVVITDALDKKGVH